MSLKLPDYLNPIPRIDNDLFNQFFFHIFCQFLLFQKCHSLIRFPLGAFLFGFLFFLRLPECRKFFFQLLHIGIILFLLVQEKLSFQFSVSVFIVQCNPAFCAASIDLIVELILSLTDKREFLFMTYLDSLSRSRNNSASSLTVSSTDISASCF